MTIQCVECRRRKIGCDATAGTDCTRCTKNTIPCIKAPRTQEQRNPERPRNARRREEVVSGSRITFGPSADEREPESVRDSNDASTNNFEDTLHPTKTTNPIVLVNRQKPVSALGKRPSERAPSPSVNHSGDYSD